MNTNTNHMRHLLAVAALLAGGVWLSSGSTSVGKGKPGGGGGSFPGFKVVDLGGPLARAESINAYGEVAGSINNHAVTWNVDGQGNVSTVLLPENGGDFSHAWDINNLSEVVGSSDTQVGGGAQISWVSRALLWRMTDAGVTTIELSPLAGDTDSRALCISDTGLIIGLSRAYDANGDYLGGSLVVWQVDGQGQVHSFEIDAEPTFVSAHDVNNFGVVVGSIDGEAAAWQLAFDANGFAVGVSNPVPLGTLGGPTSDAEAIDDFGNISGSADVNADESHAVLWKIDAQGNVLTMADLGKLGSKDVAAGAGGFTTTGGGDVDTAMGNSCALEAVTTGGGVGGVFYAPTDCKPFLCRNGEMADLNSLLADKAGFKSLDVVLGINPRGWVCGSGTKSRETRAFVAIPVP